MSVQTSHQQADDVDPPIMTIGYGRRSFADFADLLQRFRVQQLIDVRSHPSSRWRPAFNKEPLRVALAERGIEYVFMGDQLGGRPSDQSCYRDGEVDYDLVRRRRWFQTGVDHLVDAQRQRLRIAVMCAEQKPEHCHRTHLIGEELIHRARPVLHIDEDGHGRSHEDVINRLTCGQLSFHSIREHPGPPARSASDPPDE